mgnify:CR=1 FL=1
MRSSFMPRKSSKEIRPVQPDEDNPFGTAELPVLPEVVSAPVLPEIPSMGLW